MAGFRKANILNLIRYHYDQNHTAFRDECRYIMQLFEQMGDLHLVDSIRMMLECEPSYFVPMYKGQPWTYSGADEVRMGLPPVCGRVESPIPSEHGPRFIQPTGTAHTSGAGTPAPSHVATSGLRNIPAEVANASNFELVTAFTPPTQYNAPVYGKNNTIASREPRPQLQYLEPFPLKKPKTNLQLPSAIQQELDGLRNALRRDPTLSKFLFQGPPGTGKTEMVVQLAQSLGRELYCVDFTTIVDSKLGQTQKNLVALFREIEELVGEGKKARHLVGQSAGQSPLILFDELDALALDRVGSDDLREMGRVTSILLRELDRVSSRAMIIATTNLFQYFDKALVRRFDAVVDFSRYTREDLLQVAESFYDQYLHQYQDLARNTRLFKKIIANMPTIPYPGELKNLIRTSMAFSSLDSDTEYFSRLWRAAQALVTTSRSTHPRNATALTSTSKANTSRISNLSRTPEHSKTPAAYLDTESALELGTGDALETSVVTTAQQQDLLTALVTQAELNHSALNYSAPNHSASESSTSAWNLPALKEQGFSLREIEIITGIPKSTVARMLGEK